MMALLVFIVFLSINFIIGFSLGVGKLNKRCDEWEREMLKDMENEYKHKYIEIKYKYIKTRF